MSTSRLAGAGENYVPYSPMQCSSMQCSPTLSSALSPPRGPTDATQPFAMAAPSARRAQVLPPQPARSLRGAPGAQPAQPMPLTQQSVLSRAPQARFQAVQPGLLGQAHFTGTPPNGSGAAGVAPAELQKLIRAHLAALEQAHETGRLVAAHLDGAGAAGASPEASPNTPGLETFNSNAAMSMTEPLLFGGSATLYGGAAPQPARNLAPSGPTNEALKVLTGGIFPDIEQVKDKVKSALETQEYAVEDLYYDTGICQRIARDHCFHNLTCIMILLNAIWIGVETDFNASSSLYTAPLVFKIGANLFCSFFFFEILVRFFAFRNTCDALKEGWFLLDLSLVTLMIWDTWIETTLMASGMVSDTSTTSVGALSTARIFRLLRLARVLRMGRLFREMPQFVTLARGLAIAARSVFSTLVVLLVIIYVFSIVFVQMLRGTAAATGCFENIPQAVNCLFLKAALPDQEGLVMAALAQDWMAYFAALLYFVVGSLTLMNMLVGSLVEVVSVVSREQSDHQKVEACKEKMASFLKDLDSNDDHKISRKELARIMTEKDMVATLVELEVNVEALIEYADVVFKGKEEFAVQHLVELMLQFRSTSGATVKDLTHVQRELSRELALIRARIGKPGSEF